MEHIAQRTFTRQGDLQRNILNRGGRFDSGGFRLGFSSFRPASFITSAGSTIA
jgi:hypothetical protein